jgi:hypothetical protein
MGCALIFLWTSIVISGRAEPQPVKSDKPPASARGGNVMMARIGVLITSDGKTAHAKGLEKVKAGDRLRIYVQPQQACRIYVVHTDHRKVTLLTVFKAENPGDLLALPGPPDFYEVDGESPSEDFTIICSAEELIDISNLFKSGATYKSWASVERKLLEEGKNDLSQKPEKPLAIAGNVRALDSSGKDDPMISGFPIYSGTTLLVKRYEFAVKK